MAVVCLSRRLVCLGFGLALKFHVSAPGKDQSQAPYPNAVFGSFSVAFHDELAMAELAPSRTVEAGLNKARVCGSRQTPRFQSQL